MPAITKLTFAASAAALMLAACGASTPTPTATATESATPSAPSGPSAGMTPLTAGSDVPGPKPGLWRMTATMMGQTSPPQDQCIEKQMSFAEAEKEQQQAGVTCSEQSYKSDGAGIVGHSVCTGPGPQGPMTMTSDIKVTGDVNSKYTTEMTSKISPPPAPNMAEITVTVVSERVGDCPKPK